MSKDRRWLVALTALTVVLLVSPIVATYVVNLSPLYREIVTTKTSQFTVQYTISHARVLHVDETSTLRIDANIVRPDDTALAGGVVKLEIPDGIYQLDDSLAEFKCELLATDLDAKRVEKYSVGRSTGDPGPDHQSDSDCIYLVTPRKSGNQSIAIAVASKQTYRRLGNARKGFAARKPGPPVQILSSSQTFVFTVAVWKPWIGPDNIATLLAIVSGIITLLKAVSDRSSEKNSKSEPKADKLAESVESEIKVPARHDEANAPLNEAGHRLGRPEGLGDAGDDDCV